MNIKDLTGFSPKELVENRHGYDDSGMSLAPGNDEGEDSWDYSAAHDRIGAGDPRRHRQHQIDVPHDVHINGKKWKTFGSHSHASNVAKKIKGATVHKSLEETSHINGKIEDPKSLRWKQTSLSYEEAVKKYGKDKVKDDGKNRHGHSIVYVHVPLGESASVGATSSANIATVANPNYANNANSKPVKSVNALDQDDVSLFGAPMESMKKASGKKAAIIKRR